MKYKSKGVYVNKVGDKYYLYRAHCVYDKKTKKNVRVSDGYLGRVTQEDGFIPAKDKVSGPVLVFEFGIYFFLSKLLNDVYHSFKNNRKRDSIMSLAVMHYLNNPIYEQTALFHIYKKTNINHFRDETVKNDALRVSHMLDHFIKTRIDDNDWEYLKNHLPSIHLVRINNQYYLSSFNDELKEMLEKYNMEVKING